MTVLPKPRPAAIASAGSEGRRTASGINRVSEQPPMLLTASEIRAVVIGALLAMALAAVDQTIIATALPAMARALGDVSLLSWIVSSCLLTSSCAVPAARMTRELYA